MAALPNLLSVDTTGRLRISSHQIPDPLRLIRFHHHFKVASFFKLDEQTPQGPIAVYNPGAKGRWPGTRVHFGDNLKSAERKSVSSLVAKFGELWQRVKQCGIEPFRTREPSEQDLESRHL